MKAIYELWDWDSANIINTYGTEDAALAMVAGQVEAFGKEAVTTWTLLRASSDGFQKKTIAEGEALAELALRAPAHGDS